MNKTIYKHQTILLLQACSLSQLLCLFPQLFEQPVPLLIFNTHIYVITLYLYHTITFCVFYTSNQNIYKKSPDPLVWKLFCWGRRCWTCCCVHTGSRCQRRRGRGTPVLSNTGPTPQGPDTPTRTQLAFHTPSLSYC